ncbi:ABC transporter permease [Streptomyces sp. NPDC127098]|uniref:ABC transporter permease n=1 Tax=Streptomyces sp. NPDC127098 TaxID=3347137 RepID=UPI00364C2721
MSTVSTAAASRRATTAAVLRAEARLFLREPGTLFWLLLFPALLLAIVGAIPSYREVDDELGGLRVIDLYVPVTVLLGLLVAGCQAMPPIVTGYRERGILRRMSTTPVPPSAVLVAQMVLNGVAALVSALLALAVGRLVYDVALPDQPLGYGLALLLAVAAALALGGVITALAPTARLATAVGTALLFPMMFCVGVWIPIQTMPDVLARIVETTPFGAAAQALGEAAAGDWPGWYHLGVLAAWTAAATATATRWFRWE